MKKENYFVLLSEPSTGTIAKYGDFLLWIEHG
jgi:hypothetical protein